MPPLHAEAADWPLQLWAPCWIEDWEFFPNLQSECSHGPLLPICSLASIVLWLQPLPARWEQRKPGWVLFLGGSSGQQSWSCTEEGRVASNACSSLAVQVFQCFLCPSDPPLWRRVLKVKIDLLMQCLAGCVGWRGGNSSLVVLPKF